MNGYSDLLLASVNGNARNRSNEQTISDHADAFASILETAARRIRLGMSAEDAANELLPVVRVAARRV